MSKEVLQQIVKFFGEKIDAVTSAIHAIKHPEIKFPEFPEFPEMPEFPEELSVNLKNPPKFPTEMSVEIKNPVQIPEKIVVVLEGIEKIVGERGLEGPEGKTGPEGEVGLEGPQGKIGPQGPVGPEGPAGQDGKDGSNGEDGTDGKNGKPGKDGSPDTGEEIIEKVNADKSKKKIKRDKVEGFKEIEEDMKTLRTDVQSNSSFFTKFAGDTVRLYDLSSSLNGVTKTFTLPTYGYILLITGSSTPWFFRPTVDYTVSGATFTFTSAIDATQTLASGQSVGVLYKIP